MFAEAVNLPVRPAVGKNYMPWRRRADKPSPLTGQAVIGASVPCHFLNQATKRGMPTANGVLG